MFCVGKASVFVCERNLYLCAERKDICLGKGVNFATSGAVFVLVGRNNNFGFLALIA